jgi:hypothetical protein
MDRKAMREIADSARNQRNVPSSSWPTVLLTLTIKELKTSSVLDECSLLEYYAV